MKVPLRSSRCSAPTDALAFLKCSSSGCTELERARAAATIPAVSIAAITANVLLIERSTLPSVGMCYLRWYLEPTDTEHKPVAHGGCVTEFTACREFLTLGPPMVGIQFGLDLAIVWRVISEAADTITNVILRLTDNT
jgi:hypothetical protein